MLKMLAPLILIVGSNTLYNVCAKSMPNELNAFGALTITYLVGATLSAILFMVGVGPVGVEAELRKLNWAPFVLGIVIVGLEVGYVFMYRAGWTVGTGSLVANTCLAVALLIVGALLYKEIITIKQVIGVAVCAVGLFLVTS